MCEDPHNLLLQPKYRILTALTPCLLHSFVMPVKRQIHVYQYNETNVMHFSFHFVEN
jgi:hypothetical protein